MRKPTAEELEKARTFFEDQRDWLENNWTEALAQLLADHAEEAEDKTLASVTRAIKGEGACLDPSLRREKCTKPNCPKCKPVRHG